MKMDIKKSNLDKIISVGISHRASDIHFNCGHVYFRIDGQLTPVNSAMVYSDNDFAEFLLEFLGNKELIILAEKGDVDISYKHPSGANCRVNVFKDNGGTSIALRILNTGIPSPHDLHIPHVIERLIGEEHGLILICGPTGAGKSTTIASLINKINYTQNKHIISIEDPVEYIFPKGSSVISQREIGKNCESFHQGLKSALRQDPDIIFVGELRDKETIETTLSAAETGHLVFSTLHAGNSAEAIDRLTHYFPAEQQSQIRHQLTLSFLGIVTQRLCIAKDGGRAAAFEILLKNAAICNVIRKNELNTLKHYMNVSNGMQTMEAAIQELKMKNLIL